MKKWSIKRKTPAHFGISDAEAKAKGLKVVSIEDDATVNYKYADDTEWSANLFTDTSGGTPTPTPLTIYVEGSNTPSDINMVSGATEDIDVTDSEGNVITYNVASSETNYVTISGTSGTATINAVADGTSTITISSTGLDDVEFDVIVA